jgi:hypothetical protein
MLPCETKPCLSMSCSQLWTSCRSARCQVRLLQSSPHCPLTNSQPSDITELPLNLNSIQSTVPQRCWYNEAVISLRCIPTDVYLFLVSDWRNQCPEIAGVYTRRTADRFRFSCWATNRWLCPSCMQATTWAATSGVVWYPLYSQIMWLMGLLMSNVNKFNKNFLQRLDFIAVEVRACTCPQESEKI